MKSKNSINKANYNLPKYLTCRDCEHTLTCPRFDECSFLLGQNHVDDETFVNHISQLKAAIPFPYNRFGAGYRDSRTSSDKKEAIYLYHRSQVNDALHIIRKGGTAYVYTEQVLKDILKLENKADVSLQDGIYYIRINNN